MLRCGDGSLYTGVTNDLPARVARHGSGKGAAYTRSRLPVALVFCEPALDRGAALRREAALKRLTRTAKLALVAAARPAKRRRAGRPAGGRAKANP
jgi:putative endonuclease